MKAQLTAGCYISNFPFWNAYGLYLEVYIVSRLWCPHYERIVNMGLVKLGSSNEAVREQ